MRLRASAARLAFVAFLVGVLIGAMGLRLTAEGSSGTAAAGSTHVVQPGETLWAIANTNSPPGSDPRRYIYRIQKLNDLSGPLLAGQEVRLPAS